ncbi:NAD-dependent epimerase/dehydratase family protein [Helicobacter cinaedi]|uniref:NAD-dependent epimerase/dehydratase domain-containing protein n=2 Tax=Helicobacter cinaedi TaxID=213 RepID=A0ABN0BCM7_9HELI|nr:NAD-dependent epimerase/dehydratase family protein [Helicobacter cinaedi]EFR47322.1 hypothetical protein HCCG_01870 [Helicobacter cinaedi CCUG 18818 = ATCC BAA-847]BBB19164.1 UDP-glucose 4-epimerase [Helicobacter cinaedi]
MPNKKILVTGGAGYIGSHANTLLNTLGFQTIVLDNLVYGHKESLHYAPLPFSYNNPFIAPPYSQNIESKTPKTPTAEVSCDDFLKKLRFVGCEAFFARSYLSGSAEAKKANSCKSTQETTQNLDSKTPTTQNSVLDFLTQLERNFNGGGGKYTGFSSL